MARKIQFENGEYYHIYNRGVEKRAIFLDEDDYWKFFDGLRDFNNETCYEQRLNALGLSAFSKERSSLELGSLDFKELGRFLQEQKKIVHTISYNLISNHFHSIMMQLQDGGISNIMHKLGTSYTNNFNKKNKRSGYVFQGPFQAVHIESEGQLLWLFGYVNGNVEIHGVGKAKDYAWSSYQAICKELRSLQIDKERSSLSNLSVLSGLEVIRAHFTSAKEFEEFVQMVIKESRTKKEMKKYLLESI